MRIAAFFVLNRVKESQRKVIFVADPKQELMEAKGAAETALDTIQEAKTQLKSAKNWGIFDIIGGGLIASLAKRSRMQDMRSTLETLDTQLEALRDELKDVQLDAPVRPADSFTMQIFDIGFDNVFTDLYVQGELKETGRQLDRLEETVQKIIDELEEALANWHS